MLTRKDLRAISFSVFVAAFFGLSQNASAMHIMEGYLPLGYAVLWDVVSLPFVVWGFLKMKRMIEENRRSMTLFAMAGAFIFVISSLKIPSVTGSCSHMTGTGLGAVLFGPAPVAVLGLIVLIFQALLLAHGGLTTLGANTFSMAIAGPFVSYGLYLIGRKMKVNENVNVFLACALGDLLTYVVTALQLALAHSSGNFGYTFVQFLAVFAPTQIPLALVEGLLSVAVIIALRAYASPELKSIGFDADLEAEKSL